MFFIRLVVVISIARTVVKTSAVGLLQLLLVVGLAGIVGHKLCFMDKVREMLGKNINEDL